MQRASQKKKNRSIYVLLLCLLCAGCGKKEEITLQPAALEKAEQPQSQAKESQVQPEQNPADGKTEGEPSQTAEPGSVWVYVCGAVNTPGVYELENGSRIYQAISMAGGLTAKAASAYVNQAEPVTDGQKIYVPETGEVAAQEMLQGSSAQGSGTQEAESGGSSGVQAAQPSTGKVNINTADAAGLQTLPGIGETKASAIITYRETNGTFSSAEEIMQVEGIKEGTFRKIQGLICVQ